MTRHAPVAVSRHSEHAVPVMGSFVDPGSAFLRIELDARADKIILVR
jgi:hypothetical protein